MVISSVVDGPAHRSRPSANEATPFRVPEHTAGADQITDVAAW